MIYTYQIRYQTSIRRSDGSWIPMDNDNVDYRAYLEWLAKGNEPEEWQPESEQQ